MDQLRQQGEETLLGIKTYTEDFAKYAKLEVIEKTSVISSDIIGIGFVAILLVLVFVLGSLGFALYLGEILGAPHKGFLIISGVLLAISVFVIIIVRMWSLTPITNILVKYLANKLD